MGREILDEFLMLIHFMKRVLAGGLSPCVKGLVYKDGDLAVT